MPKTSNKKSSTRLSVVKNTSISSKKPAKSIKRGIKKIIEPSRGVALVSSAKKKKINSGSSRIKNKSDNSPIAKKEITIPVKSNQVKSFNINLAENALDVYRSPHFLDLSGAKIKLIGERFENRPKISYSDLPGGVFLEKYGILRFWDFKRSEIVVFFQKGWENFSLLIKKTFKKTSVSGKLAVKDLSPVKRPTWKELSLVRFILFFADLFYSIYFVIRNFFARDEVFWLTGEKKTANKSEVSRELGKLFNGDGPTIAEIIKNNQKEEKFKIISFRNRKEVKEKYLTDNFNRRGVVINEQKPSAGWPKSSLFWDVGNLAFSPGVIKSVAIFFGVLIALTSSVKLMSYWDQAMQTKGLVMGEAEQAMTRVMTAEAGLKKMDFDSARLDFAKANGNFVSAKKRLEDIKSFITILAEVAPAQNTYKSGTNLIEMGERLSLAGQILLEGLNQASADSDLSLASRINNLAIELEPVIVEMEAAQKNSQAVGLSHLPAQHQEKFIKLKNALPEVVSGLRQLRDSANFAVDILGQRGLKRYLLVFQNDNELRATGGFMGSFALVDFKNGKIENVAIPQGGTYDVKAGLNQKIVPPQAISLLKGLWEFQDSNWWPDFPTSAKNVKWFYEKSGGPTVDGVIAINSSFLGDLLMITGPVNLPQYGKMITAENFQLELQKSIGLEAEEKNKPKKILGELAPVLLERLLNVEPKQIFSLAEIFSKGLATKEIQMYFLDDELQSFALANNWGGAQTKGLNQDYLQIVGSNISGGKTDNVIKQKIYHRAEIQTDGSIIVSVILERSHFGPIDNFFTQQSNNSYLRFYVPLGSELIRAVGFDKIDPDKYKPADNNSILGSNISNENLARIDPESGTKIYTENGKTVFANWSILSRQKTKETLLVYRLPFKLEPTVDDNPIELIASLIKERSVPYIFRFDKQSGRSNDEIISEVNYPANMSLRFVLPEPKEIMGNSLFFKTITDINKYFALDLTFKK